MITKIILLFGAVFFIVKLATAQDGWKKYQVDEAVSIKFPGTPTPLNGRDAYYRNADSTTYYVYVEDYFDLTNLTGDELAEKEKTTDLANAFKDDLMNRMHGYMLGNVTIGKWHDHTTYTVSGGNEKAKTDMYVFAVFIQDNCYYLVVTLPDSHKTDKKDLFFGSLSQ